MSLLSIAFLNGCFNLSQLERLILSSRCLRSKKRAARLPSSSRRRQDSWPSTPPSFSSITLRPTLNTWAGSSDEHSTCIEQLIHFYCLMCLCTLLKIELEESKFQTHTYLKIFWIFSLLTWLDQKFPETWFITKPSLQRYHLFVE